MREAGNSGGESGRLGVVLVHGLGDCEPGQVLKETVYRGPDATTRPGFETEGSEIVLADQAQERILRAEFGETEAEKDFRYFERSGHLKENPAKTVTFGEVYWSDIKFGSKQNLPPILMLFGEILNGHYIYSALHRNRNSLFATAVLGLVNFGSILLRGPILAFNVLLLSMIYLGGIIYTEPVSGASRLEKIDLLNDPAWVFVVAALMLLVSGFILSNRRYRGSFYRSAAVYIAVVAVCAVGLALASKLGVETELRGVPIAEFELFQTKMSFFRFFFALLLATWIVVALIQVVCTVAIALGWMLALFVKSARSTMKACTLAMGVLVLQISLWGLIVRPFWFPVRDQTLEFTRDPDTAIGEEVLRVGEHVRIHIELSTYISSAVLTAFLVVLMMVMIWRRVAKWAATRRARGRAIAKPVGGPRVVFNMAALGGFIIAEFVGLLVVLPSAAAILTRESAEMTYAAAGQTRDCWTADTQTANKRENFTSDAQIDACYKAVMVDKYSDWLSQAPKSNQAGGGYDKETVTEVISPLANQIYDVFAIVGRDFLAWLTPYLIALLLIFRSREIVYVASVLEDILNYNGDPRGERKPSFWRRSWLPDRKLRQRDKVTSRFQTVADHMLSAQGANVDRLLIVAHSQGTVVTFDALKALCAKCEGRAQVDVVTLGSPLRHIYKEYFPEYRDFERESTEITDKVASWTNFYRVNDPIGVTLGPAGAIEDMPLGAGGHKGYWFEPSLRSLIVAAARGEDLTKARHANA